MKRLLKRASIVALSISLPVLSLSASQVSMTADDTIGNSSFNSAGHWSNGAAPSAGNDYFTGDFILRTPPDGNSYTFAGDSLTVNNANGYPYGLLYKGTDAGGVITINNLILSGGYVSHANGIGDVFQLAGSIDVVSNSTIYAKQGEIFISSVISGSGNLTIPATDAPSEDRRYVHLLANNSSYSGKLIVNGRLDVASDASLGAAPASLVSDQLTLDGGWLSTTNTFTLSANRGINLGGGGGTIKVTNPDTNAVAILTVAGPISGSGTLDKRGRGVLALAGNNSFSGDFYFDVDAAGSQVDVNSANALGSGILNFNPSTAGPAFLDNTSGGAVTLANNNLQIWQNDITFLGSGNLDMGSGPILMLTNITVAVSNNNLTVGALGDDGLARNLVKNGPGTLTVNGGITFFGDGNTTVNGGVLALVGTSLSGSPVITVSSNATLDVSAAGGLTLTSTLLGTAETLQGGGAVAGDVADDGTSATTISPGAGASGTLTINGNLTLNGGSTIDFDVAPSTTVGGGVNDLLVVANQLSVLGHTTLNIVGVPTVGTYTLIQYGTFSGSLGNFSLPPGYTLTNNTAAGAIQLVVTVPPVNLTWKGDGVNNIWDVGATANWLHSGTNHVFYNGDSVTFDDSGSDNPAITLAADVSPLAVTVDASQDYTLKGSGILTGSLTKNGSGKLVLDNTNSYSGPTVISGGILQVGDWTAPGGGLGGSLGMGNITNNASLVFSTPVALNVPNPIQGTGTLTMNGSGTVALNGSNSYTGPTLVTNGTLEGHSQYALRSTAGVVVTNSGRLYLTASADYTNDTTALTIGTGTLQRGGGHSLTWGRPITLTGNATFNVDGGATLNYTNPAGLSRNGANLTFAGSGNGNITGPLSLGSGSLTVVGGVWSVAPTNAYTGKTFLNGGRLYIPDLEALGPASAAHATPDFVTFNGGVLGIATNATFSGGLRGLTVTGTNAGTLYIQNSSTVTIASDLYGGGIFQKWQGTLVLKGSNPFVGTLEVDGGSPTANDGITRIASPTALSSGVTNILQRNNNSGYSTLQLDGTAGDITLPQEFQISCRNNDNPNIENVAGNNTLSGEIGVVTGGNRVIYQSDAGLLTLSGTNAFVATATAGRMWVYTGAGDILVSGPIVGSASGAPISIEKSGSGATTLSADNTYDNTTTISGGALLVDGSITSTGGVFVVGGALGGSGIVNDNVTVTNSSASGTMDALTVNGNFTIAGPLAVDVNRSGFQSDHPIVSGVITNTGTGSIVANNLGAPLQAGDRFVLFSKAVDNGAALTISGGGAQWQNNLATDGSITVSSVVPVTPTNITFNVSGHTLSLAWPDNYRGWILQVQTNALSVGLNTNWVDVPGSAAITSTNIALDPETPTAFYRLRAP